ncbi:icarapin-like [Frieseomelitta varia]|uniref:icarapin-like n=1 Tax=Frieseomelitta varia TaxID=561572 RepID=UPI001CB6946F|nr:icarapin-like [Frieseomelitta varia]
MKIFAGALLIAACFVAYTHSFPGARDTDTSERKNVDSVLVLPADTRDQMLSATFDFPDVSFEDSLEDSAWNWNRWFRSNLFDGLYSNLQAQMKRLRDQMAGILSHIPEQGVVNWSKIPEGANTTSTTKVINGHVLTINETTYTDGNDEYSTLIRVRVIDVRPQNDTLLLTESEADPEVTTLPTTVTSKEDRTTPSRSVETVEEFDNEIPKNQVDTLTA